MNTARALTLSHLAKDIIEGRDAFLVSFSVDEEFARHMDAPRFAVRAVRNGLTYGYRRPGDEEIIGTLASHYQETGRRLRCLEIGAGVTAQWMEITGHLGSPWLSRYLALQHSDRFEIIATDITRSQKEDHLSMSMIHWPDGAESWQIDAETFYLWKKDISETLYNKLVEVFSSQSGCGIAVPASEFGLAPKDFRPVGRPFSPRITEARFRENLIVLPQIVPSLEKSIFNLRFEEGVDISSPPDSLGKFDVIFGRHLGIGKNTLLDSIPRLADLLEPDGEIFLYTDYSPWTVRITYRDGRLTHTFPD